MNEDILDQLNNFIKAASKATYAGDSGEVDSWREGFNELEYQDNDWYYRDSYTGFFKSWGQETVWHKDQTFWTMLYGGGMVDKYKTDKDFALLTFGFLKKVMSANDIENFQLRGPKEFNDGDWEYKSKLDGDISNFKGSETITYKGELVFTHEYFGGLVLA